jgi:hypothetical protein
LIAKAILATKANQSRMEETLANFFVLEIELGLNSNLIL